MLLPFRKTIIFRDGCIVLDDQNSKEPEQIRWFCMSTIVKSHDSWRKIGRSRHKACNYSSFLFTIIVKGSDILRGCGLFSILTLLSLHTFQVLSILRDLLIVLKSGGSRGHLGALGACKEVNAVSWSQPQVRLQRKRGCGGHQPLEPIKAITQWSSDHMSH